MKRQTMKTREEEKRNAVTQLKLVNHPLIWLRYIPLYHIFIRLYTQFICSRVVGAKKRSVSFWWCVKF